MTVNELYTHCKRMIDKGFGNKSIVISNDDEGNGYHSLFYPFLTDKATVREVIEETESECWIGEDINDVIILG